MDAFSEVHPEDREHIRELFRTMIETGFEQRSEFRFLLRSAGQLDSSGNLGSARVRFIESQSSLIRDENGVITNVVTVSRDITERKHTEERMQQIQSELERTNHDLMKKNEEIQSFYHTLSHELKTPLTSAREFISIVMDGLAGPLAETQFDYLRIAKESCNQLRVCLNDLLDSTRLETGKLRIELKPASLGHLVHQVISMMNPVAARKGIRLSKQVQRGVPDVLMDENRITQVITNLLNNALKFTPEGGKISIRVAEASDRSDFVQVAVTDTGRGIPREQVERIFDRLYQIQTGDASTGQGIGLGLYICRELVDLHGGHIWAESELGQGSTFTFELPKQPQVKQTTVLVVDDDPTLREVLRGVLQAGDFTVITAEGGNEAIRLMHGHLPDVILMDLKMPDLDGAAALKEIRKTWGHLPVIVHTGYPNGEVMTRALESSPFTVLAKPCAEAQLIGTVRMVQRQSETSIWKRQRQNPSRSTDRSQAHHQGGRRSGHTQQKEKS
jgi:PAS domain S-box-containing protein